MRFKTLTFVTLFNLDIGKCALLDKKQNIIKFNTKFMTEQWHENVEKLK